MLKFYHNALSLSYAFILFLPFSPKNKALRRKNENRLKGKTER